MTLNSIFAAALAAARPGLDRPDEAALEHALSLGVEECGRTIALTKEDTADGLNLRECLARAARILAPNTYVHIANFDAPAIAAAIASDEPVQRRYAALQYFIGTIGDRSNGTVNVGTVDFSNLVPDGEMNYVPYVDGDPSNVTLESVAKAEAAAAQPVETAAPKPAAEDTHPLDALSEGKVVTITSPGIVRNEANGVIHDATDSATDAVNVLPIGTTIEKVNGQIKITGTSAVAGNAESFGEKFHDAVVAIWAWIEKVAGEVKAAL